MGEQLFFITHAFSVRVLAFVLMNNHFHLILHTPESNLDLAMGWFMRETSRSVTRTGSRINQTYGGRYFRSVLADERYFLNAYKYVYLNPVKAGLVDDILDYPFSSLPGLLGLRALHFPVFDTALVHDPEGNLAWLRRIPESSNWESFRKALRRKVCQLPKVNKEPHPLESELL